MERIWVIENQFNKVVNYTFSADEAYEYIYHYIEKYQQDGYLKENMIRELNRNFYANEDSFYGFYFHAYKVEKEE